jgi:hypothetical protein
MKCMNLFEFCLKAPGIRGALVAGALVFVGVAVWLSRQAQAQIATDQREIDLAMGQALAAVLAAGNAPSDPSALSECTAATLAITRPDLAIQERRKDPGFAKAEAVAIFELTNPQIVEEELMSDANFRELRQSAMRSLSNVVDVPPQTETLLTDPVRTWPATRD